jgi:hypothetical protein
VLMNKSQYLYKYYYVSKIRFNIHEAISTPIAGALLWFHTSLYIERLV